jgi:acyl-CoA thioester hydrolase
MERSRTEYLRNQGIDLAEYHQKGLFFVVIEAHVKYRASAVYNDLLDIESVITELTSATITFRTTIRNEKTKVLVTGDVRLAVMRKDGHVGRIPKEIADMLE